VQFRWTQPLGNELRTGLQLSSNARTAHAERLIASRAARAYCLEFLARCNSTPPPNPARCARARSIGQELAASSMGRARRRSNSRPARTRRIRPSICPAASYSPPVNGRPKSWARCLRTKPLGCRRIFGRRRDSRFSRSAIGGLVGPRALEKNRIDAEFRTGAAVEGSGY
jgi:hypothetical protein